MKAQTANREEIRIIVSKDGGWFHLCDLMQSAGTNEGTPTEDRVGGKIYELWFPTGGALSLHRLLFKNVEAVLMRHGIAHNLVDLERVRPHSWGGDYLATYNKA